jgi:predicted RNA binding protein with dsRBD fold (UPF0201 family)
VKELADEANLRVEAEVNPTEDPLRVQSAIIKLFEPLEFQTKTVGERVVITAESSEPEPLAKFGLLLQKERIRSVARRILYRGLTDNTIVFFLNKQVAYAGHISFCEPFAESPLGPIRVEIDSNDPMELIEWLAPRISQPQKERPRRKKG